MSFDPATVPFRRNHIFWLFGLSGAGKSTLGDALSRDLRSRGFPVLALDGDDLRNGLCHGLGFFDDERQENLRRAAEVARLGSNSGLCVVASFITPLESHRRLVASVLERHSLAFIHLNASFETCRQRDAKGLYAQAAQGKIKLMTGLSSPFEPPSAADLAIATGVESPEASYARLREFALARLEG